MREDHTAMTCYRVMTLCSFTLAAPPNEQKSLLYEPITFFLITLNPRLAGGGGQRATPVVFRK